MRAKDHGERERAIERICDTLAVLIRILGARADRCRDAVALRDSNTGGDAQGVRRRKPSCSRRTAADVPTAATAEAFSVGVIWRRRSDNSPGIVLSALRRIAWTGSVLLGSSRLARGLPLWPPVHLVWYEWAVDGPPMAVLFALVWGVRR